MAIILALLQISLCFTLAMTQQSASNNTGESNNTAGYNNTGGVWFYKSTDASDVDSSNSSLLVLPERHQLTAARRNDYTYTPGIGAHKVHTAAASWSNAWLRCRLEGADLAIINSEMEKNLIVQLLDAAGSTVNGNLDGRAYIGVHSFYYPEVWVTIEGQSLSEAGFSEWHEGEPSAGEDERCGSIYASDGKFNDQECSATASYVCELPDF